MNNVPSVAVATPSGDAQAAFASSRLANLSTA